MSTFEDTRGLFSQTHFTIIEIDLPVVEGFTRFPSRKPRCTLGDGFGFGTPLSCDQPSNGMKTYKFAEVDSPILPGSGIYRLITSISETPTELKSGRGIASRASLNITFTDIVDADPNPFAPGVTAEVKASATYMSKFAARNVFKNRNVRIKNYRVEADGSIDLENGAETRHYISESLNGKNFKWSMTCKDELSRINIGESVWPLPLEGSLRTNVNASSFTFNVDANTTYLAADTVRIGDELIKIDTVANIGTGSATFTTIGRSQPITYTNILSLTKSDSHDASDEVYVCEVSDNERLDDLLERILVDIGIDASLIPKADWIAELDEWLPTARINTLWLESKDTAEILEQILTDYLIDMWFDPVAREIKLSAINVWKQSVVTVKENNQIDFETIGKKSAENLRTTRAFIVYDKRFLATSDSFENYKKAALFKRTELEDPDLFGEPKTKRFNFSHILESNPAKALVNRYVNRYIDPQFYTWKTQERKLDFSTGDVVGIDSSTDINFDGSNSQTVRAQIVSIKTNYTNVGRDYSVKALSYEPVFADNSELVITNETDVDLYNDWAGTPSEAITITFIFDGSVVSGTSSSVPSIRTGNFPVGSKVIIILASGADLQGKGGNGGDGQSVVTSSVDAQAGLNGSVVIEGSPGIDIEIYFSGPTPSTNYPIADGFIRAPSGGNGGDASFPGAFDIGGDGGDGGSGRFVGNGGAGGSGQTSGQGVLFGDNGSDGVSTSGWGVDGVDGLSFIDVGGAKGLAGSGVIDNGATVTFFGETSTRYINGNGDH